MQTGSGSLRQVSERGILFQRDGLTSQEKGNESGIKDHLMKRYEAVDFQLLLGNFCVII